MKGYAKRWQVGLIAAVTIAIAVVGSAMASIPDSSGTITACYKSPKKGQLRVIDAEAGKTCTAAERTISWGGGGLPPAFYTDGQSDPAVLIHRPPYPSGDGVLVARLHLPAGSYVLNASVWAAASDVPPAESIITGCVLAGGRTTIGDQTDDSVFGSGQVSLGRNGGPSSQSTFSVMASGVLAGPGQVSLVCHAAPVDVAVPALQNLVQVRAAGFSAVQVASLGG